MTTKVTVSPSGHRVRVEIWDLTWDSKTRSFGSPEKTSESILEIGDPDFVQYATTTREIRVVDLEPK